MQRIKSINKQEVDDTIDYFQSVGLELVKRGASYINRGTISYWAVMK